MSDRAIAMQLDRDAALAAERRAKAELACLRAELAAERERAAEIVANRRKRRS